MKATIVDLRYRMNDVLKAMRRREKVSILYRGKTAGIIVPATYGPLSKKVKDHAFFGSSKASGTRKSVAEAMQALRGGRFHDL